MTTEIDINLEDIWKLLENDIKDSKVSIKLEKSKCDCINSNEFIDNEYVICINCGIILDSIIDESKDYTMMNNNGEKNKNSDRTGQKTDILMPNISMQSGIIGGNGNLSTINKWVNNACIPYNEKVLMKYKFKINELVQLYKISQNIVTDILYKIKELIELKNNYENIIIHRGKIYTGLISVCFYYTCKENNLNIPPLSISNMFEIDVKTFNKCCKIYNELITKKNNVVKIDSSLITRFFGELNIPIKFLILAKKIQTAADDLYITNKISPQSNISGLVEFLNKNLNLEIDINDIIKTTNVSESTVKKIYKLYSDNKILLFNYMKFHM